MSKNTCVLVTKKNLKKKTQLQRVTWSALLHIDLRVGSIPCLVCAVKENLHKALNFKLFVKPWASNHDANFHNVWNYRFFTK